MKREDVALKSSITWSKDLVSGLVFITIGLAFLWIGSDYRFGSSSQMGPGYFPVVLSILLTALGSTVAVRAVISGGERISGVNVKGIVFVIGATFIFGLLIRPLGMPVAIFILAFVGAIASKHFHPFTSVLLAAGLSAFCMIVFNWGLGMPFPIWGYWFG
jgi:hypothetical protein